MIGTSLSSGGTRWAIAATTITPASATTVTMPNTAPTTIRTRRPESLWRDLRRRCRSREVIGHRALGARNAWRGACCDSGTGQPSPPRASPPAADACSAPAMIAAMTPRAILLDALGTLLALEDPAPRLHALLRERHAIEVDRRSARRARCAVEMALLPRRTASGAADDAALRGAAARVRRDRRRASSAAPRPSSPPAVAAADAARQPRVSRPIADVRGGARALARRRARGSSSRATGTSRCTPCSRRPACASCSTAVVTSAEVGAAKPAGELFAAALVARRGRRPGSAVHIGDSLERGRRGRARGRASRRSGCAAQTVEHSPRRPGARDRLAGGVLSPRRARPCCDDDCRASRRDRRLQA